MSGAASRLAAAQVLTTALKERRTLDESLSLTVSFNELTGSDRGFARAMASAALRQLGRLKRGLNPFLKRDFDTIDLPVQALLLVGAAQLWLLDTPAHAGVSETVSATKSWPQTAKAAGLINAVLRKAGGDRTGFDAAPILSVWPDWLADLAVENLGQINAEKLALSQTTEPSLHLSVKPGHLDEIEAAFAAEGITTERLSNFSISVPSGAVGSYPLYDEGKWWVQDIAAGLPAQLLTGGPERTLVDLCAAPGGKTMQLAATGARVYAVDRSRKRLQRLSENLERTKLTQAVEIIAEDGASWTPPQREQIDGVLVDAPCSALGTLRRHPEGAWIKRPDEIAAYFTIQIRLLEAAMKLVRPGGEVIYCVCSPFQAEGAVIIDAALKNTAFARAPIQPGDIQEFDTCITSAGDLLTLPDEKRPDHDAFFIARLIKEA